MAENDAPERIWIGGEQHQLISANRRGGGNYYHERASYRSHTDIAYVREHANLAAPDVAQKAAKGLEQLRVFIKQHRHTFISAHESEIVALINSVAAALRAEGEKVKGS